jgi:hypothetical protein
LAEALCAAPPLPAAGFLLLALLFFFLDGMIISCRTRHYFWRGTTFSESREKNATYVCHALLFFARDSFFFQEASKSGAVAQRESA